MNTEAIEKRISNIIIGAKTRQQVFERLQEYLLNHTISTSYLKDYYWLNNSNQVKVYSGNNKEVLIFKDIITDLRKKDIFTKRVKFYLMITNSFKCIYKITIFKK